ncbi:MAG TPA: acyl-CoA dehydrogenase, partial [Kiloniellales bacterium]|nr:acyl-CoA dehydrogenase [Kiloniellales bacterium]
QYLRDARIATIYEGTNGIQALDLLNRKLLRDEGAAMRALLDELGGDAAALKRGPADIAGLAERLSPALDALAQASDWLLQSGGTDPARAAAGASPFLRLFGTTLGGAFLAQEAAAAARLAETEDSGGYDPGFLAAKRATARFYADNLLPETRALADAVLRGAESTLALDESQF